MAGVAVVIGTGGASLAGGIGRNIAIGSGGALLGGKAVVFTGGQGVRSGGVVAGGTAAVVR